MRILTLTYIMTNIFMQARLAPATTAEQNSVINHEEKRTKSTFFLQFN